MSFAKSPLRLGRNGRAAHARFVEVEMPAVAAGHLVVELEGGGRVLLCEPAHVALLGAVARDASRTPETRPAGMGLGMAVKIGLTVEPCRHAGQGLRQTRHRRVSTGLRIGMSPGNLEG